MSAKAAAGWPHRETTSANRSSWGPGKNNISIQEGLDRSFKISKADKNFKRDDIGLFLSVFMCISAEKFLNSV